MKPSRWCHVIAVALVLTKGVAVQHAFAQASSQPAAATPRWFVGLGGGTMHPVHSDDEREGGVVLVSFGYTANSRVRVEAEFTRRARSTSYVYDDVFLYAGPNGLHGRADRIDGGRETTDWTVGANLIGSTGGRIVTLFGGPGVVLHREQLREHRTVTRCAPPIPSSGAECLSFDNESSQSGAGLQLMAGVDVALHRRVTAFVAGRGEYRRGLTMGGVGVVAGVRVGVR